MKKILPKTISKNRNRKKIEIIEIDINGNIVGWCEVLKELKLLKCSKNCRTCYCG